MDHSEIHRTPPDTPMMTCPECNGNGGFMVGTGMSDRWGNEIGEAEPCQRCDTTGEVPALTPPTED